MLFPGLSTEIGKVMQKVGLFLGYALGGNAMFDETSIGFILQIKCTGAPQYLDIYVYRLSVMKPNR